LVPGIVVPGIDLHRWLGSENPNPVIHAVADNEIVAVRECEAMTVAGFPDQVDGDAARPQVASQQDSVIPQKDPVRAVHGYVPRKVEAADLRAPRLAAAQPFGDVAAKGRADPHLVAHL